jgi:four helix bundle protein
MTKPEMIARVEWEKTVEEALTGDPLWTVQAYRIAMYAIDCHTFDRTHNAALLKAPSLDQLSRAIGSVAANIAEGYSRFSGPDRVRFYGYALGSAREAIAWYGTLTTELGAVAAERQAMLVQVRRLLLTVKRARADATAFPPPPPRRRARE